MRIMTIDQSMHRSGAALAEGDQLCALEVLSVSQKLKGLEAMWAMRDHIFGLALHWQPSLIVFEETHLRQNVKTMALLSGFLHILLTQCHDMGIPFETVSSNEFSKFLKLGIAKANRETKANRARFKAQEIIFGNANLAPDVNWPSDDEVSAIILLATARERRGLTSLTCATPERLFEVQSVQK